MSTGSPGEATNIQVSSLLTGSQSAAVLDLAQRAAEEDGVSPLSEHVMLHLRYGRRPAISCCGAVAASRVTRTWIPPIRSPGRAAR
jgi:hypothetical protein